jgi:hypothetical protein
LLADTMLRQNYSVFFFSYCKLVIVRGWCHACLKLIARIVMIVQSKINRNKTKFSVILYLPYGALHIDSCCTCRMPHRVISVRIIYKIKNTISSSIFWRCDPINPPHKFYYTVLHIFSAITEWVIIAAAGRYITLKY